MTGTYLRYLFDGITTWASFQEFKFFYTERKNRGNDLVNFPRYLTACVSGSCNTPSIYKIFPVFINTLQLFHVEIGDTEANAL